MARLTRVSQCSHTEYARGRGLSYMACTGMCRWTGYGVWRLCPKQGIYFYESVLKRVCILSFVLNMDLK